MAIITSPPKDTDALPSNITLNADTVAKAVADIAHMVLIQRKAKIEISLSGKYLIYPILK